jgi:fatty acid desaturase
MDDTWYVRWGHSDSEVRRKIRHKFADVFNRSRAKNSISLLVLLRSIAMCTLGIWTTTLEGGWVVIGALLVGLAQYHLSVAVHEACHFGLFTPRWLNDAAGSLIGLTLGFGLSAYRRYHMSHHQSFGLADDPDRRAYEHDHVDAKSFALQMVREYTVIGLTMRVLASVRNVLLHASDQDQIQYPYAHPAHFAAMQVVIFGAFCLLYAWWAYFAFWFLPLLIFPGLLNGIRMYGEHAGLRDDSLTFQIFRARSTNTSASVWRSPLARIECFIFGAFHFNFHHEHHLFPQLPYHRLPELHRRLQASGYFDADPRILSPSYSLTFSRLFAANRLARNGKTGVLAFTARRS